MSQITCEPSDYPKPEQFKIDCGAGSCLCTIYHNDAAKVMIIDNVIVKEEFRGMGYGTLIMSTAVLFAELRNVDSVELVVNGNNEIARKLYTKLLFTETNKKHCRRILKIK